MTKPEGQPVGQEDRRAPLTIPRRAFGDQGGQRQDVTNAERVQKRQMFGDRDGGDQHHARGQQVDPGPPSQHQHPSGHHADCKLKHAWQWEDIVEPKLRPGDRRNRRFGFAWHKICGDEDHRQHPQKQRKKALPKALFRDQVHQWHEHREQQVKHHIA
nr:hypothetical protein [Celeribacter baekdonensis]